MRILHIITTLSVGGAETMLRNVALGVDRNSVQHRVISLTTYDPIGRQLEAGGVGVLALYARGGMLLPGHWRKIRREYREWSPDIVNGWMYHANVVAHWLSGAPGRTGRPALAVSVRGALNAPNAQKTSLRLVRALDARLSRRADVVLFNSRASAEQHRTIGYDESRMTVIPNGFDTYKFSPRPDERVRIRETLGLGSNFAIGMIARFEAVKGQRQFLEAAVLIAGRDSNARFLLIGSGCDRDNAVLRSWIRERNLDANVQLLGLRDDVPVLLNGLDLCVCPSISESFPNAVGEAMATAVPCIVTDVGDCARLVGDPLMVVPPDSAKALSDAVLRICSLPAKERAALGADMRERIRSDFSMEQAIADHSRLYARLFSERTRSTS